MLFWICTAIHPLCAQALFSIFPIYPMRQLNKPTPEWKHLLQYPSPRIQSISYAGKIGMSHPKPLPEIHALSPSFQVSSTLDQQWSWFSRLQKTSNSMWSLAREFKWASAFEKGNGKKHHSHMNHVFDLFTFCPWNNNEDAN